MAESPLVEQVPHLDAASLPLTPRPGSLLHTLQLIQDALGLAPGSAPVVLDQACQVHNQMLRWLKQLTPPLQLLPLLFETCGVGGSDLTSCTRPGRAAQLLGVDRADLTLVEQAIRCNEALTGHATLVPEGEEEGQQPTQEKGQPGPLTPPADSPPSTQLSSNPVPTGNGLQSGRSWGNQSSSLGNSSWSAQGQPAVREDRVDTASSVQRTCMFGAHPLRDWLVSCHTRPNGGPHERQIALFTEMEGWRRKFPVQFHAAHGNCDQIHTLVTTQGYDAHSKMSIWHNSEPLGWAASFGQLHAVITLIEAGADPLKHAEDGTTPLQDAQREGHQHIVDFLVEYRTKFDALPPKLQLEARRDRCLRARNNAPSSRLVQFRFNDITGCNSARDLEIWLDKDGLSRDELPAALEHSSVTMQEWSDLLGRLEDLIRRRRQRWSTWCILSVAGAGVGGLLYHHYRTMTFLSGLLGECRTFEDHHTDVRMQVTTVGSSVRLPALNHPTLFESNEHQGCFRRGAIVVQIIVLTSQTHLL